MEHPPLGYPREDPDAEDTLLLIASIIAVCIILLILAFLAPRLSRHPQRAVDRTLGKGQRTGGKLPGFLGRFAAMPFGKSRRAANKSAAAGRRGRFKLPWQ